MCNIHSSCCITCRPTVTNSFPDSPGKSVTFSRIPPSYKIQGTHSSTHELKDWGVPIDDTDGDSIFLVDDLHEFESTDLGYLSTFTRICPRTELSSRSAEQENVPTTAQVTGKSSVRVMSNTHSLGERPAKRRHLDDKLLHNIIPQVRIIPMQISHFSADFIIISLIIIPPSPLITHQWTLVVSHHTRNRGPSQFRRTTQVNWRNIWLLLMRDARGSYRYAVVCLGKTVPLHQYLTSQRMQYLVVLQPTSHLHRIGKMGLSNGPTRLSHPFGIFCWPFGRRRHLDLFLFPLMPLLHAIFHPHLVNPIAYQT